MSFQFKGFIFLLLSVLCFRVEAQDAQFSQFYASGLYLNPALAGAQNNLTFSSNYRNQWRSAIIPYVTSQLSMIAPLKSSGMVQQHLGGIGLSAYFDRAGDGNFKTTGVNMSFAYNLPISYNGDHTLSAGMQVGFVQKSLDPTNLNWGEQFNPYIGYDASILPNQAIEKYNIIYPDFNGGLIYYFNPSKNYQKKDISGHLGLSAYHLNSPDESLLKGFSSKLPRLFKAHGGVEFKLSKKTKLSPNFLYATQNNVYQLNTGLYLTYRAFNQRNTVLAKTDVIFGVWHRLKDSFIASIGLDNESYTLGFSYDMNTSNLRSASQGLGAFEISLAIRKVTEKKMKKFSTPRI